MAAKKDAQKKEKLDIELLALQVRRLANEFEGVGEKLKGIGLSKEELKTLLGELRAVRHLLDAKGEFRHLDKATELAPSPGSPP